MLGVGVTAAGFVFPSTIVVNPQWTVMSLAWLASEL
jgi:hypothetical protein